MSRIRNFLINTTLAAPFAAVVYAGSAQWSWPAQLGVFLALVLSLLLWRFESSSTDWTEMRNVVADLLVAAPVFAVLFYGLEHGGWGFNLFIFSLVVRMFLLRSPTSHAEDTVEPGQRRSGPLLLLLALLTAALITGTVVWHHGKPVKPVSLDTKPGRYPVAASATAMAVMFTTPREVTEPVRICAGLAVPSRIGPTGSASPNTFMIW